jgi:putative effector of murein hydrolase LrgA (UPF0299 family)
MEFKVSNYGKPRNKRWKLVTKFLVMLLPAYMGVISVTDLITEPARGWTIFALSMAVATVQVLSEFTSEPIPPTDVPAV